LQNFKANDHVYPIETSTERQGLFGLLLVYDARLENSYPAFLKNGCFGGEELIRICGLFDEAEMAQVLVDLGGHSFDLEYARGLSRYLNRMIDHQVEL